MAARAEETIDERASHLFGANNVKICVALSHTFTPGKPCMQDACGRLATDRILILMAGGTVREFDLCGLCVQTLDDMPLESFCTKPRYRQAWLDTT